MRAMSTAQNAMIFALSAMLHIVPLMGLWQWSQVAPEPAPESETLVVEMVRLAPPDPPSERPPGPVQTEASAPKETSRRRLEPTADPSIEPLLVEPRDDKVPSERPSVSPPAPATTAPLSRPAPPAAKAVTTPPDWRAHLLSHIERYKRYPAEARIRRQEGVAVVGFTVDSHGKVLSRRLVRSSGVPLLDAEAMRVLRAASPLPLTADAGLEGQEIVVALEFFIE
ncbi:energy transducer TonB [Asticcacaulis sp. W401b]|uniref:energy transducer TonB family protein n=1 Tax=Asticcacaulis sp. W401b TaxID=3388666 RepID=UPI003970FD4E